MDNKRFMKKDLQGGSLTENNETTMLSFVRTFIVF